MSGEQKISGLKTVTFILLMLASVASLLILITDRNLQTDFGATKPYYYHWYGLLLLTFITLLGGSFTLIKNERTSRIIPVLGSLIPLIFILVDVFFLYGTVGFHNPDQFATYLFGLSKYPDTLSYLPGLFDIYTVTLVIALITSSLGLKNINKT